MEDILDHVDNKPIDIQTRWIFIFGFGLIFFFYTYSKWNLFFEYIFLIDIIPEIGSFIFMVLMIPIELTILILFLKRKYLSSRILHIFFTCHLYITFPYSLLFPTPSFRFRRIYYSGLNLERLLWFIFSIFEVALFAAVIAIISTFLAHYISKHYPYKK